MTTHTIKGWIALAVPDEFDSTPRYGFFGYKPSGEYYVPIREHTFEVEVEDNFDPRPLMVAALEEQKREILAEAGKKATDIEARIQSILAIEYTPEN